MQTFRTSCVSDGAEEIEERNASNVLLRKYVYGSGTDDRIAMLDSSACAGGRCYYLTNWQDSTTTLVNQNGTLNAVYHYGPYEEGVNWTPSDALTGNPFRYTGRRVDPETGLYYYRARYYSPKLGRFPQTDPIGTKDDFNLYAYVGNDAINKIDSNGAWSREAHVTLTHYALGDRLASSQLGILTRQSLNQDVINGDKNYMHFLRDPGQSPVEAMHASERYIARQLSLAR